MSTFLILSLLNNKKLKVKMVSVYEHVHSAKWLKKLKKKVLNVQFKNRIRK